MSATSIGNIHIGLYVDVGDQRRFTEVANLVERDSRRMNTSLGHTTRAVSALRTQMSQNLRLKLGAESLRTLSRATDDISRMRAALTGLAAISGVGLTGALSAAYLLQTADKARLLSNQLKTVTDSTSDLNAVQEQLFEVSQRTRSSFEATTTIYARTARATETLGTSQEKLLRITETVQKAFAIGGASTQEAQGAAIQLSQGIASDRLGGEEFRSVAENAPVLLKGIADSLGVNIGKLREMAHAGELTARVVTDAIVNASAKIDAEFGKTASTVSQGITMMDNAFLKYIGSTDESYGVTRNMASALQGLAENFEDVMWWVTRVGAGLALLYTAHSATRRGQSIVGGIKANNSAIRDEMRGLLEQNKEIAERRAEIAEQISRANETIADAETRQRFDQAGKMHSAREKEYAIQESIRGLEEKRAQAVDRMQAAQGERVARLRKEVDVSRQLVRDNALRVIQAQEAAAAEERNLRARQEQRLSQASENVASRASAVASANSQLRRSQVMLDRERVKAEYDAQVKYDEARARKQMEIDQRRSKLIDAQQRLRTTQSQISDLRGISDVEGFDKTFGKQYRSLLADQQKAIISTDKLRKEISGLEVDLGNIEQKAASSRGLTAAMTANERAIAAAKNAVQDLAKAEEARAKIAAAPVSGKTLAARLNEENKQIGIYQRSIDNLQKKMADLQAATTSAFSGKGAVRMAAEIAALDKKIQGAQSSLRQASAALADAGQGDPAQIAAALQRRILAEAEVNDLTAQANKLVEVQERNITRLAAAQSRLNVVRRAGSRILDFFGGGIGLGITVALVAATSAMAAFAARAAESAAQTERITKQLRDMGYLAEEAANGAIDFKKSLAEGKISKLQTELSDFREEVEKTADALGEMDIDSSRLYDGISFKEFDAKDYEDAYFALTQYELKREQASEAVAESVSKIRDQMVSTKGMTDEMRKSLEKIALANPGIADIIRSLVQAGEIMNALKKATDDWVKGIKEAAEAARKGAPSFRELEIKSMNDLKTMNAENQPMLDEMDRANNRTAWEAKLKEETDKIIAAAEKLGKTISISAARVQAEENLASQASKKGLRDLIGHYEGTDRGRGYNETLDRGRWTGGNVNLTSMTLREILDLQSRMRTPENRALYGNGKGSSAVGRYQIVSDTLKTLIKQLGLSLDDVFTPELQDRMADQLIRGRGRDVAGLRNEWEGLRRAPEGQILGAFDETSLNLPAMDESVKKWVDGLKDLDLQNKVSQLKEFDQSVLQTAESMGATTEEMQQYIAAVNSGNLDAIPEKFKSIVSSMKEAEGIEFGKQFKELHASNIVQFLSDIDQEVVSTARSLGIAEDQVQAFISAAMGGGQLGAIPPEIARIREEMQRMSADESIIKFADGAAEAVGDLVGNFIRGKGSIQDFLASLADLAIQILIVEPLVEQLKGAFRGIGSGLSGGGAGMGSGGGFLGGLLSIFGLKDGGPTANVGRDQVAGFVHGQEYVMDADTTKAIGVDELDALREFAKSGKLGRMRAGFKAGGPTSNMPRTISLPQIAKDTWGDRDFSMPAAVQKALVDGKPTKVIIESNDDKFRAFVQDEASVVVKEAAPKIVGTSVKQANKNVVPEVAKYRGAKQGADYRND